MRKEGGLKVVKLNQILRQRHNPRFKLAVEWAAEGRVGKSFQQMESLGNVIEIANEAERLQQLVADYTDVVVSGKSALILSPTRKEGRTVTHAVRDYWREKGVLKGERAWERWKATGWTDEEKRDVFSYQKKGAELVIGFHQNAKGGFKKGDAWQVKQDVNRKPFIQRGKEMRPLPIEAAKNFTVYRKEKINLGVGDKIRITKNSKSKEGTKLHNGMTYFIKGFNAKGEIKLHTGKTLPKDFVHLDYGVVTTSVSSQGSTVSEVFISQAHQSLASSQNQYYVSISRARDRARIYTGNKLELAKAVMREDDEMTARELALDIDWEMAHLQQQEQSREELEQGERGKDLELSL